jgi:hypothetical protein
MKACMGGWCTKRGQCPHYTEAASPDVEPEQRLCIRGRDGERLTWAAVGRVVTVDVFTGIETSKETSEYK